MSDTQKSNMELWTKICTTDPRFTKPVSFGKFKFTDIDSTWNIKRATELWGPYGSTWGLKEFFINVIYGGGDKGADGLYIVGTFHYPGGQFMIAADMPYDPKGETLKKLQTMCIGKALSRLGFSADVYEGKFDDSAYVKAMEKEYVRQDAASDSGNADTVPVSTPKTVAKSGKTRAKYPEPDPNASGILGSLAQKYMDIVSGNEAYKGKVVSFEKVCRAVYDKFNQYPTRMDSIPYMLESIPVDSVIETNDFLQGITE